VRVKIAKVKTNSTHGWVRDGLSTLLVGGGDEQC
jgi:hypothetical protein